MDQPTPEEKDKKVEEGCDSRNFYTGWNVSTEQSLRQRKNEFLMQLFIFFILMMLFLSKKEQKKVD